MKVVAHLSWWQDSSCKQDNGELSLDPSVYRDKYEGCYAQESDQVWGKEKGLLEAGTRPWCNQVMVIGGSWLVA